MAHIESYTEVDMEHISEDNKHLKLEDFDKSELLSQMTALFEQEETEFTTWKPIFEGKSMYLTYQENFTDLKTNMSVSLFYFRNG